MAPSAHATEGSPANCPAISTSFESAPASGAISGATGTDCYTLTGTSNDHYRVELAAGDQGARALVRDSSNNIRCSMSRGTYCEISNSPSWRITVFDEGTGAFSYSLAVRRLNEPSGCVPLGEPAVWSFAEPRIDGSIDSALGARCYSFSRVAGEEDGSYWFRALRTAGSLQPEWRVYGPSGNLECQGSSADYNSCRLLASGQYALVVDDVGSTPDTGSFLLTAKRATSPAGCATVASTAFDGAPSSGSIATAGEIDCHTISGSSGDAVSIDFSDGGSSAQERWFLVNSDGEVSCALWQSNCTLQGTGPWRLLVFSLNTDTFSYSLAVRRLNSPAGCTPLGEPTAWSFSGPRIDGSIDSALDARCYTFSRAAGEEDGSYWFRTMRTAGTLQERWQVYGPTGNRECQGTSADYQPCRLLASGQYAVVVDDGESTPTTGSFLLTAKRATSPAGCATVASTAFGGAPSNGSIATAGEIDCHTISGSSGDALDIDFTTNGPSAQGRWFLVDGSGEISCVEWQSNCRLEGNGPWRMLVFSLATSTFSYSFAAHRLNSPSGCTPLGDPAVWSFTAPRIDGSIDSALGVHCYTFSRAAGEEDGSYWFRTMRTAGTLQPNWQVFGPTGNRECQGGASDYQACRLLASGQYALVVGDGSGEDATGSYLLSAKRATSPAGCGQVSSIAFGLPPVNGKLGVGGEIDCYRVAASAGDLLDFNVTGAAQRVAVIDASGDLICWSFSGACTIPADQQLIALVYSTATNTGGYSFSADCLNVPCGQAEVTVVNMTPNRLGQGGEVSTILRGRDLELLESAALVRGGEEIPATLQPASADGRAIELRFDLAGAQTGSWDLRATFAGGVIREIDGGAIIESERPPLMSLETLGRDAFRPGVANRVTLEVTNEGNVDGLAVPLVIGGLPEGAEVTPAFTVQEPVGPFGSGHLEDTEIDPSEDIFVEDGEATLPLIVNRVPAGRSVRLDYDITVPSLTTYRLRASVGQCLSNSLSDSSAGTSVTQGLGRVRAVGDGDPGVNCVGGIARVSAMQEVQGLLISKQCEQLIGDVAIDVIGDAAGGDSVTKPRSLFSWALGGGSCAFDVIPLAKAPKIALTAAKWIGRLNKADTAVGIGEDVLDCVAAGDVAEMQQRGVIAIDPNEIIGPTGSGDERFIPGDERLGYQVLFENLPAATAPAQRVEIVNQLNPAIFEPGSVLFREVSFGSTVFTLPYEEHEVDETIDLRPGQELLVHVTASVDSGGKITAVLQAIDPETLVPPTDPLVGLLPPNVISPEGEGQIDYSVRTKSLASGTVVPNQASITFDGNEAIETPTWTNKVDKLPPAASASAQPTADPSAALVSWSGSDDAAGVSRYEVRVSVDGGPFLLWQTAEEPGSETFVADRSGVYSFRVIAHDGANNVGQSGASTITLDAEPPTPPPADGGDDGGPTGAAPSSAASGSTLDRIAPVARISRLKINARKGKVTAIFAATDEGGAATALHFECRLDRRPTQPCRSPKTYSGIKPGRHRLTVSAIDAAGNVSAGAARQFTVTKPPRTRG